MSRVETWAPVEPFRRPNGSVVPLLATVDALHGAWRESVERQSPEEFMQARRRILRHHAIETGIIERLYDVDWGVTKVLVADGLTLEAVARAGGGLDDDTLAAITSQFEGLEFLAAEAREGRELTLFLIRQLHQIITKHQLTYRGVDSLGRLVELPLRHGEWKQVPNHVDRPDGTRLEYAPPAQVEAELQRLLSLYAETAHEHPVLRATWLHHSFIRIHPFEDGNGRVGRALVLLTLLRGDYAPLVIEGSRRADYIDALDAANDGDLAPLARLFSGREIAALRSEIERPREGAPVGAGAVDVARAVTRRLRSLKEATVTERVAAVGILAAGIQTRLRLHLETVGDALRAEFGEADTSARHSVASAAPDAGDERFFWHAQLVRLANRADFYTNLADGSWWVRLHLVVLRQQLRYVVAIQKVGQGESGVLAVTAFAENLPPRGDETGERSTAEWLLDPDPHDAVTLVHTDAPDLRWPEVRDMVDRTLAAAVASFGRAIV